MPVRGVRDKSPKGLKFRKFSFRFVLCLFLSLALLWMLVIEIIWVYRSSLEFGKLINIIFDSSNLLSILCFLELARKWPNLMLKWYEVEKFLPQLKYQMDKQKMAYEIKMVSFMILFISMGKIKCLSCFDFNFLHFSWTSFVYHGRCTWRQQLSIDSRSNSCLDDFELPTSFSHLSLQWSFGNFC